MRGVQANAGNMMRIQEARCRSVEELRSGVFDLPNNMVIISTIMKCGGEIERVSILHGCMTKHLKERSLTEVKGGSGA